MSVPVFHHVPKPISFIEFSEAVRATCPPRFPHALHTVPRRVALAVSGGADSMALAFLFSRLRTLDQGMKVADNSIVAKPTAFVVDHRLRPTSTKEANRTIDLIQSLSKFMKAELLTIHWARELGLTNTAARHFDPNALPNVETLARRLRYRRLGMACAAFDIASLFTAHHQDDQYETVLMRLLNGHRARGLRGMAPAANIPECFDIHGAYESGFVDDQLRPQPYIRFHPRKKDWRLIRRDMRRDLDKAAYAAELRRGLQTELDIAYIHQQYADGAGSRPLSRRHAPPLPPLPPIQTEDAGVVVYRPLLAFPKDRLIATCEANNVPWIEDPTNKDPTMTMRNAVRYMWKGHDLPAALSKPAILALSRRCAARAKADEAEADRWATRMVIRNFQPNIGTLTVRFPDLAIPPARRPSRYARRRHALRLSRRRTLAALLIRRAVAFATPEPNPPAIASLQTYLPRLFPSVATPSEAARLDAVPKAFNQASVLFIPVPPSSSPTSAQEWLLTREPHPSRAPLPFIAFRKNDGSDAPFIFLDKPETLPPPDASPWTDWRRWTLWDGRFWVRLRMRFKGVVRIGPLTPAHAADFRTSLPPADRARLTDLLRRHAPGKVRYTLPALYAVDSPLAAQSSAAAAAAAETGADAAMIKEAETPTTTPPRQPDVGWWRGQQRRVKMLGLLTVPVHLPGLERWLQWEARYKKVDTGLLGRHASASSAARTGRGDRRRRWVRRLARGAVVERRRGRAIGDSR
ncbi:tRNA(Ile)-lysidine synthase like protein [Verticillium longisporum]|nr:tRNA(Ile)-lysidine synthase like protein [Verticillium longisporum]